MTICIVCNVCYILNVLITIRCSISSIPVPSQVHAKHLTDIYFCNSKYSIDLLWTVYSNIIIPSSWVSTLNYSREDQAIQTLLEIEHIHIAAILMASIASRLWFISVIIVHRKVIVKQCRKYVIRRFQNNACEQWYWL